MLTGYKTYERVMCCIPINWIFECSIYRYFTEMQWKSYYIYMEITIKGPHNWKELVQALKQQYSIVALFCIAYFVRTANRSNSPRARARLLMFLRQKSSKVVSYVEFTAESKYCMLTKNKLDCCSEK